MNAGKRRNCSICDGPHARAYRVAGMLLRYVCEECFQSRCIHCGKECLDATGNVAPGVTFGIYYALYCADCSAARMEFLLDADVRKAEQ